jgi:type VI secretion system protein ImpH
MATEVRRSAIDLIEQFRTAPGRFEFFQAVRLLQLAYEPGVGAEGSSVPLVGYDLPPQREPLRFLAYASASFPAAAVRRVESSQSLDESIEQDDEPDLNQLPERMRLVVTFLGLTGPSGVMPQPFTTMLLQMVRSNERALEAFQDLFNHRLISLYYRAWEKHRPLISYERCRRQALNLSHEPVARTLLGIAGLGLDAHSKRFDVHPESFVRFAGHFARRPRTATGLEDLSTAYFGVPVKVHQFQGHWAKLGSEDLSRMPRLGSPRGQHAHLGSGFTIGSRVWVADSRVMLDFGPLTLAQYRRFLPTGGEFAAVQQIVRTYIGVDYDATIRLVLRAADVPTCRMGSTGEDGPRLGWTTFVSSQPFEQDVVGAQITLDDL